MKASPSSGPSKGSRSVKDAPAATRAPRHAAPTAEVLALAKRAIEARISERCPKSLALAERGRKVLPGGVAHDNRYVGVPSLYMQKARGARKYDVDGRGYIDYWVGHGALLMGHGRREIVEAVHLAAQEVMHPGACHEREVLWAERVRALIPTAECVRFTASGSEASALAVRLARGLTGRDAIVKFEGHFHGWLDHAVNGIDVPFETPWSVGVPGAVRALTRVLPANDLAAVERALEGRDVAALILEPTGASGGSVPLAEGFLEGLREACSRHGTLLIFDEVITGFRVAPGGMQAKTGVRPDLTCLAKVLAGGMPGGAVCGPKPSFEPMQFSGDGARDRTQRVAQYGTFNASPVCAAAGNAMLRLVQGGEPCRAADQYTAQLKRRLNALFKNEGVPFAAYGVSSVFHLFTAEAAAAELLRDGEIEAVQIKADRLKKKGMLDGLLRRALLLEGVDLPPGRQAWVSAAHGDEELEETVDAFARAIHALRELDCL
ncbi:MAG: aminotransferase class III-fold pyridoxal phosphate-dependent enzyme [Planctomycetota bacterium]|nr:aminotransferase class III-fold pyridoxal phosphate-dependent enzyme [Planctomycetota bacterium]